jgi:hypothetical protein
MEIEMELEEVHQRSQSINSKEQRRMNTTQILLTLRTFKRINKTTLEKKRIMVHQRDLLL